MNRRLEIKDKLITATLALLVVWWGITISALLDPRSFLYIIGSSPSEAMIYAGSLVSFLAFILYALYITRSHRENKK